MERQTILSKLHKAINEANEKGLFQDKRGRKSQLIYEKYKDIANDLTAKTKQKVTLEKYTQLINDSIRYDIPIKTSQLSKIKNELFQADIEVWISKEILLGIRKLYLRGVFGDIEQPKQNVNFLPVVLPIYNLESFPLNTIITFDRAEKIKTNEDLIKLFENDIVEFNYLQSSTPVFTFDKFVTALSETGIRSGYNDELLSLFDNIRSIIEFIIIRKITPNTRPFISARSIQNSQARLDKAGLLINKYRLNKINHGATEFTQLFEDNERMQFEGFRENCCAFSILIKTYKKSIETHHKKFGEVNYKSLFNLCKNKEDILDEDGNIIIKAQKYTEDGSLSCSCIELSRFFEQFRLSLTVYDNTKEHNIIYEYIPENPDTRKKIYPSHLRLILSENHFWKMDENIKVIEQMNKKQDFILYQPSNKYIIKKEFETSLYYCNNESELIVVIKQLKDENNKIYFNGNLTELLFKMKFEYGINVNDMKYKNGEIEYIGLQFEKVKCRIFKFVYEGAMQLQFKNQEEYNKYCFYFQRLYKILIKREHISHLNDRVANVFKSYVKCPHSGLFDCKQLDIDNCYKVDANKFYLSLLMKIKEIPIISYFDDFEPYDNSIIKEFNLYLIKFTGEYNTINQIITKERYTYMYGFLLNNLDSYEIISVLKPCKFVSLNGIEDIIKEMYDDNAISNDLKKFIVNTLIGMTGKKYNKNKETYITSDIEEAGYYYNDLKYMHTILQYGDKELHLLQKTLKTLLNTSLYPIQLLIYDLAKQEMIHMINDELKNFIVFGIKVDCLYVSGDIKQLNKDIISNKKDFDSIGKYKIEKILDPTSTPYSSIDIIENNNYNTYEEIKHTENILKNEEEMTKDNNTDECNKILEKNTIILAELAGSGKTTVLSNYKKELNEKKLFVCPTGELCEDNKKKSNCDACTINQFTETHVIETIKMPKFDSSKYEIIMFDEIYQLRFDMLEKIYLYMLKHPEKKYYATGDINQLKPISDNRNEMSKEYFEKCILKMFNNVLTLRNCCRMKSPKDKEMHKNIKKDLFENNLSNIDIINKYFKERIVKNLDKVNVQKALTYYTMTRNEMNRIIYRKIFNRDVQYFEGLELRCIDYLKIKKDDKNYRFIRNDIYKIIEINENKVKLKGYDNEIVEINNTQLIKFDYIYASTVHSSQGKTIDEPYIICDYDSDCADKEWLYVALTRTISFDNVYILFSNSRTIKDVKNKIKSYKTQDKKAKRNYKEHEYINYKWITDRLRRINYKCERCLIPLQPSKDLYQWTVNRIDNSIAHTKINCEITCLSCNHSYK